MQKTKILEQYQVLSTISDIRVAAHDHCSKEGEQEQSQAVHSTEQRANWQQDVLGHCGDSSHKVCVYFILTNSNFQASLTLVRLPPYCVHNGEQRSELA